MTVMDFGNAKATARRVLLSGGDYEVSVSEHADQIEAAQRLRFNVFNTEPGYSDAIGDAATGRDADAFDEYCEHMLVRHLPTDKLVGCARVLPPPRAIAAGGWYSAGEFDLDELGGIRGETVEMGRAVVDAEHRSGSVTATRCRRSRRPGSSGSGSRRASARSAMASRSSWWGWSMRGLSHPPRMPWAVAAGGGVVRVVKWRPKRGYRATARLRQTLRT